MSVMSVLRSAIFSESGPAVRHGFSTRVGGVSMGRYAGLNLGGRWGDDPAHVAENRRVLAREGGFDVERLYTARQVHGGTCLRVDEPAPTPGDAPSQAAHDERTASTPRAAVAAIADAQADALSASTPGVTVGVYTADCVPLLFSDGGGRHVAAAHAGWRGTVANIAAATLGALVASGARLDEVRAAIGPSIGPCCFEVGEEVAEAFESIVPQCVLRPAARRPHVDLWRANAVLLEQAGLPPDRIDAHPLCTVCHPELFYSYRRDGAETGQMLSFITAGSPDRPVST